MESESSNANLHNSSSSHLISNLTDQEAEITEFIRVLKVCPCLWHKATRLLTTSKERVHAYMLLLLKRKAYYRPATFRSVRKIVQQLIQLVRVEETCGKDIEDHDLQGIYKLLNEPGDDEGGEQPDDILQVVLNSNKLLNELDFLLCTSDEQLGEYIKCPFCYWMAPDHNRLWSHMIESYIDKPKRMKKTQRPRLSHRSYPYNLRKVESRMAICNNQQLNSPIKNMGKSTTSMRMRGRGALTQKIANIRASKSCASMAKKKSTYNALLEKYLRTKNSNQSHLGESMSDSSVSSCNKRSKKAASISQCKVKSNNSVKYNLRSQRLPLNPDDGVRYNNKINRTKYASANEHSSDSDSDSDIDSDSSSSCAIVLKKSNRVMESKSRKKNIESALKARSSIKKARAGIKRSRQQNNRTRKAPRQPKKCNRKQMTSAKSKIKVPNSKDKIQTRVGNEGSVVSVILRQLNSNSTVSCATEVSSGTSEESESLRSGQQIKNNATDSHLNRRTRNKARVTQKRNHINKPKINVRSKNVTKKNIGKIRCNRKVYKTPSTVMSTNSTKSKKIEQLVKSHEKPSTSTSVGNKDVNTTKVTYIKSNSSKSASERSEKFKIKQIDVAVKRKMIDASTNVDSEQLNINQREGNMIKCVCGAMISVPQNSVQLCKNTQTVRQSGECRSSVNIENVKLDKTKDGKGIPKRGARKRAATSTTNVTDAEQNTVTSLESAKRQKISNSAKPQPDAIQDSVSQRRVTCVDTSKTSKTLVKQQASSLSSIKGQSTRTKVMLDVNPSVSKGKQTENHICDDSSVDKRCSLRLMQQNRESEALKTILSSDSTKPQSSKEVNSRKTSNSSSNSEEVIFIPTKEVVIEIKESPCSSKLQGSRPLVSQKGQKQRTVLPRKIRQRNSKYSDEDLSGFTDTFLKDFIKLYQKHECLWKRDSELYADRDAKISAYDNLLSVYRKGSKDGAATLQNVKRVIRRLRVYNRQIGKPSSKLLRSNIYNLLDFLSTGRPIKIPNSCTHCGLSFSSTLGLRRHAQNVHNENRPYKCQECHLSFKYKAHMGRHFKNTHIEIH